MENLEYFRRRLWQEKRAARQATCAEARVRHEELATAYRLRLFNVVELPVSEVRAPASTRGCTA